MPGKIVRVLVKAGDDVKARQGLVVVEAMKMENELRAARDGRVRDVAVAEGPVGRRRRRAAGRGVVRSDDDRRQSSGGRVERGACGPPLSRRAAGRIATAGGLPSRSA